MHAFKRDREVDDEQELVALCEGRFSGLKAAFALGGGGSMLAKDLRSYTEDRLLEEVEKRGGERILVLPWLDYTNLRPLLRDYQSHAVVKKSKAAVELPHDVDARARLLLAVVKKIQGTPEKLKPASEKLSAQWPLMDREDAKSRIEDAVRNNLQRFQDKDSEKRDWNAVVLTAASGAGKSRLMREAPLWIAETLGQNVGAVYNVSMTFVNGYQLEQLDMIDATNKILSGSIAIGLRVAARIFPQLGACSPMSLNSFRRELGENVRLCELRTVMRAASMIGATDKPRWVTLLMDEVHDAEHPKNVGCDGLWEGMVNAVLSYMIPGDDSAPCLDDNINLFPIMASTWTNFRTAYHISPVEKVFVPFPGLSSTATTTLAASAAVAHPSIRPVLQNQRFMHFLVSCALVPDGLRMGLETTIARMADAADPVSDELLASIAKAVCVKFANLYKPGVIPTEVLEFSMSGIPIPDVNLSLGQHPFSHWLEIGFASGGVSEPLAVPFPTLSNLAGTIVPVFDSFTNWGQPFYWQDFEALVPHIIRLRCSSLYRIKANHCAMLKEIFGSGVGNTVVQLVSGMSVVTCTEQWLVKKSANVKSHAHQLKIKSLDKEISVSATRTLEFGSQNHVFAAADGNVHFDGHKRFQTEDDRSVVVFYQVKHTRIHPDKNVAHFDWTDINTWLVAARTFTKTFQCDVKLFLIVTNKVVHGVPANVDDDLVLIHNGNLDTFFAPCFVSSAHLATNKT